MLTEVMLIIVMLSLGLQKNRPTLGGILIGDVEGYLEGQISSSSLQGYRCIDFGSLTDQRLQRWRVAAAAIRAPCKGAWQRKEKEPSLMGNLQLAHLVEEKRLKIGQGELNIRVLHGLL